MRGRALRVNNACRCVVLFSRRRLRGGRHRRLLLVDWLLLDLRHVVRLRDQTESSMAPRRLLVGRSCRRCHRLTIVSDPDDCRGLICGSDLLCDNVALMCVERPTDLFQAVLADFEHNLIAFGGRGSRLLFLGLLSRSSSCASPCGPLGCLSSGSLLGLLQRRGRPSPVCFAAVGWLGDRGGWIGRRLVRCRLLLVTGRLRFVRTLVPQVVVVRLASR